MVNRPKGGKKGMKTTRDTYTGQPFRWNSTCSYLGWLVPERMTSRTAQHLHPSRVTPQLLARLNDGRVWCANPRYVNVYLIDRAYGGPEEGGWWYGCGQFIRGAQVITDAELDRVKACHQKWCDAENANRRSDISSVLSEGRYVIYVEEKPGRNFPKTRPHYE